MLLQLFFVTLLLLKPSEEATSAPPRLVGHIVNERYYDAKGTFSVGIPFNDYVEDKSKEDLTYVMFVSRTGELVRVEVASMSDEFYLNLLCARDTPECLKEIYRTCVYNPLQAQFPQATITHDEIVELGGNQPSYYAIVSIPEENLLRGYLTFLQPNQLVCLTYQNYSQTNLLTNLLATQRQFKTKTKLSSDFHKNDHKLLGDTYLPALLKVLENYYKNNNN